MIPTKLAATPSPGWPIRPKPSRRRSRVCRRHSATADFRHFELPSQTIADLYRCRWQIELFFKWIKQHLRIKHFFGNTENAVKTQIWIAVCVYVLIAIVKKRLALKASLYTILQMVSVTAFEKTPLDQLLNFAAHTKDGYTENNQLNLFNI